MSDCYFPINRHFLDTLHIFLLSEKESKKLTLHSSVKHVLLFRGRKSFSAFWFGVKNGVSLENHRFLPLFHYSLLTEKWNSCFCADILLSIQSKSSNCGWTFSIILSIYFLSPTPRWKKVFTKENLKLI